MLCEGRETESTAQDGNRNAPVQDGSWKSPVKDVSGKDSAKDGRSKCPAKVAGRNAPAQDGRPEGPPRKRQAGMPREGWERESRLTETGGVGILRIGRVPS